MGFFDTLTNALGFNNDPTKPKPGVVPVPPRKSTITSSAFNTTVPKNSLISTIQQNIRQTPKRGVSRDLLSNLQSVVELPASAGRAFLTRPTRTVIKSFEELGGYLGDPNYKPEAYTPTKPWEQALYGKEPIKSYPEQAKDVIKMSKDIQKPVIGPDGEVFFKGVDRRIAIPLAFFGTVGAPLADLTPGGGEKKIAVEKVFKGVLDDILEAGLKSSDDATSFKLLKEAGVSDDIAKESAPMLSKAKTKPEVQTIMRDTAAKEMQVVEARTTARIDEILNKKKGIQIVPETGAKVKVAPSILSADEMDELAFLSKNKSKPENIITAERFADMQEETFKKLSNKIDDLETQAKTMSKDEFVNGQGTFYRGEGGTNIAQGKALLAEGKHFASDAEYPKGFGRVGEYVIKPEAKILELGDSTFQEISKKLGIPEKRYITPKELSTIAKEKGYDVLKYNGEYKSTGKPFTHTVDLTGDSFKTKSQLEAIWERANKNIKQVEEMKALDTARGTVEKERKYITSAKASQDISDEVSREISETYTQKSNKELVDKAVQRVDEDFEQAKKFARENSTDEAVATRVTIDKELSKQYENATTEAQKKALAEELKNSIITHSRLATEEGRTVQANALLGKTTPEGMLRTTARTIDDYNKTAKTKIPQISTKDVQDVLEKGKKIEKMPEGLPKEVAKKELVDKLQSMIPSPWWKKIVNVWKAGLLTGIKTSGINISSSFFNGVTERIKDIPATGIDLATSLITGKRTKALTLKGLGQGSMEGVKKGWDYLRTGVSEESAKSGLEFSKVHFDSKPGKILEAYADTVYRVLGTEDMPFFYGALRRSLAEQAIVTIKNNKMVFNNADEKAKFIQNFIDNPPKNALELADLDAKVATFKNDTQLGKAATSVRNASPFVEFILPFAKTPSAVATAMFDYSPAGALHTIYRNLISGRFNQKDFAEGLGRSVTGMGALWLGSELYKKGKISLQYPKDEKERSKWEANGKTPNSILIGDKWFPLTTFGPAGSVLGIGGYVTKGQEETGSISGGVTSGLFGGITSLTEQTFLTGVKDLIDVIQEPEKKGEKYASRFAGSIVPTIISDFAQAFDEYQRKPTTPLETIESRIPGLRQTTPRKLDVWGQPLERNRPALATAISPFRLSNTIEGPLNTEVERMAQLGEDIRPTKVDPKIRDIKLDDREHYKYQKLYGKVLTKSLTARIKTEEYQKLDPENQTKIWDKSIKEIREGVNELILPELLRRRYGFGEDVDMKTVTEITNELYKKSPEFVKATPEKQKKVIMKLLNK